MVSDTYETLRTKMLALPESERPSGVVLPEPEPDWEHYREAICNGWPDIECAKPMDMEDISLVNRLIRALPHMPEYKAVLARIAELEAELASQTATPQPDSDGWIEWNGGECPVDRGTMIDAKFRNENRWSFCFAHGLCWRHNSVPGDIIAYRVRPETTDTARSGE